MRGAEHAAADAQIANQQARSALADAHAALQSAIEKWQTAAATWIERLGRHHAAHDLGPIATPAGVGTVVDELAQGRRTASWFEVPIASAVRHHESLRAQCRASLDRQCAVVTEFEDRAAELATRQLPDPPMLAWQRREGPCFAELIDFRQHLNAAERSALEAGLEASGVLAAEVQSDGALRLADGRLILESNGVGGVGSVEHNALRGNSGR